MFVDALRVMLDAETGIEVAWSAEDAEDGLERSNLDLPDVVLIDVRLPGMDGIAGTRQLVEDHSGLKVVVMTALSQPDLVLQAVEAGACGFITKHRAVEDLPGVIRRAAAGQMELQPLELTILARAMRTTRGAQLSRREIEVLQCLADGMSTEEVAIHLVLSPRTIQGHVQSILTKLEVHSKLEAVLLAIRSGLVHLRSAERAG